MTTDTVEAPVYLYDRLAPLGEDIEDQFSLSFSTDVDLKAVSRTVSETTVSSPTYIATTSLSTATTATDAAAKGSSWTDGAASLSTPVDEGGYAFSSIEGEVHVDTESPSLQKTVESFTVDSVGAPSINSSMEEDMGFISLNVGDLEGSSLVEKTVLLEEKVSLSDDRPPPIQEAPPWARTGASNDSFFRSPFLQLHQEIVDFCNFVAPTEEEKQVRAAAVQRVTEVIMAIWPSCQVKMFGSFATGLFLPTSDCDVVILESGCRVPVDGLKAIAKSLNRKSLVKNLQVIGKARVPIVKFIETESNISFDISFDVANGPDAAVFIKEAMASLPPLKPLCMVLKIFLQQRELNEVYTGGIGSYALLVMLLTHLQMHPSRRNTNNRGEPSPLEGNLGILLVDFFDFYGHALNVREVGISCRSGGRFYSKASRSFWDSGRPFLLSVEDPQAPDNDIGKNSYNVTKVRAAFVLAHRLLTKLEVEDVPEHVGLLGRIIRMDKALLRRKFTLPELPQKSRKKASRENALGATSSSATVRVDLEPSATRTSLGMRWHDYDDDDFPRGDVSEAGLLYTPKQKDGQERDDDMGDERDSITRSSRHRHRRKRNEMVLERGESLSRKDKRRKQENESADTTSVSPHNRFGKQGLERLDASDTRAPNGAFPKERQPSNKTPLEDGKRLANGKKNRWRKQNQIPKEESPEEGEFVMKDDPSEFGVDSGQQEAEGVTVGEGSSHGSQRKRKRWFEERSSKSAKSGVDRKDWSPDLEDSGSGRPRRKVVVTSSAHKKIKYL